MREQSGLKVAKTNLKTLSPLPQIKNLPTEKELGFLLVRKILSSFWGNRGSSALLAGGGGRARHLGQEGSTWKEPTLHTLGGPKPH